MNYATLNSCDPTGTMPHSFSISAKVQWWLNFWEQHIFHQYSWWSCHCQVSHPSKIYCHPIWDWAIVSGDSKVLTFPSYQSCKPVKIWEMSDQLMFSVCNHTCRHLSESSQICLANASGHRIICSLSSNSYLQHGHSADIWKFQHTIFFPWLKCPEENLAAHLHLPTRAFL